MKKNYLMKQCKVIKGDSFMVTWLPIKYAKKGKVLKLKENGVWSKGWKVDSVGDLFKTSDWIEDRQYDYKKQRMMSDI